MISFEQALISLLVWLCRVLGVGLADIAKAKEEDKSSSLSLPEGAAGYYNQLTRSNRPKK